MTETDTRQKKALSRRILFTSVPLLLLLAGFAYYAWFGSADRILSLVTAAALLFLYCLCIIRLIPKWQSDWSGEPSAPPAASGGKRSLRPARMHPFSLIFLTALLTRLAIFLAVYLIHTAINGYRGGILDLVSLWTPAGTRCADWLTLAATRYSASGELMTLLPFYPAAVRVLTLAFGDPLASGLTAIIGLTISTVAFSFSAWLIYELTLFDSDRDTAMTAARWFCLLPTGLLLLLPTADSVFVALCLSCMVLTRRKQYIIACLFGMIAALTRLSGVLLLLPVVIELVAEYRIAVISDDPTRHSKRRFIAGACALLLIPLGTAIWCAINHSVTGDPFFFARNGGLGTGFFFDAAAGHFTALLAAIHEQALSSTLMHGIQLLHLVLPLLLLAAAMPRLRASYSAYLLLCLALTVGAMPAEIPRLVVSTFPLCPLLAATFRRRVPRTLVTVLLFAGLCAAVWAFAAQRFIF